MHVRQRDEFYSDNYTRDLQTPSKYGFNLLNIGLPYFFKG